MKYFFFIIIFFLPIIAYADVSITEIAWMGTPESQYSEWIEFYNDSDTPVNMAGWKIYKSDNTLLFTFTKTIDAHGYLLLERTTASAPDAVPGVDDESGTFGGGGLANTGEDLVLKDANGTSVESLDFSNGWPAGDATTKHTMQWNGNQWITAAPTPKAGVSDTTEDSDGTTGIGNFIKADTSQNFTVPKESPNKPYVEFTVPDVMYSGVPYQFGIQPILEYNYRIQEGNFQINMGDGTMQYGSTITPIQHVYAYPGTYTISFSFADPRGRDPLVTGTKKVVVTTPTLTIASVDHKGLQINNTATTDVDLSGWKISAAGENVAIPPMTIVTGHASITLPFVALSLFDASAFSLIDPSGSVRATTAPLVTTQLFSPVHTVSAVTEQPRDDTAFAAASPVADQPAQPNTPKRNHTRTIVVGVVAFFVIVLSILLERFMARQEY